MKFDVKFEYKNDKSVTVFTEVIENDKTGSEFDYNFVPQNKSSAIKLVVVISMRTWYEKD